MAGTVAKRSGRSACTPGAQILIGVQSGYTNPHLSAVFRTKLCDFCDSRAPDIERVVQSFTERDVAGLSPSESRWAMLC
jgi:hypothetical protein